MAYLVGQLMGGVLVMLLLTMLFERFLFARIMDTPMRGIPAAAAAAWLLATLLYSFGSADGGAWNPLPGAIRYGVGALVAAGILMLAARGRRRRQEEVGEVFE